MSAPEHIAEIAPLTPTERETLLADDLALSNLHAQWGRDVLVATVEGIIAARLAPFLAAHSRTHWCYTDDQQPEVYDDHPTSPWPCPTLRDLSSPPGPRE